jgi:probable rRNA maturation factor
MIDVSVDTSQFELAQGRLADDLLVQAAEAALQARSIEQAEISVALLGDEDIRELNARHLGHDWVTDVISFALWQPGDPVVVGDIYIGAGQAERQALDEGVSLEEELVRLVVHGTLHVTGMDHPDGAEARAGSPMYVLQESIVAKICREEAIPAPEGGHGT